MAFNSDTYQANKAAAERDRFMASARKLVDDGGECHELIAFLISQARTMNSVARTFRALSREGKARKASR